MSWWRRASYTRSAATLRGDADGDDAPRLPLLGRRARPAPPRRPTLRPALAVSTLREQLREDADRHGEEVLERRHDAYSRLLATFRAVYGGVEHEAMRLPAYSGTLFDPDRYPFLEVRASSPRFTAYEPESEEFLDSIFGERRGSGRVSSHSCENRRGQRGTGREPSR